MMISGVCFIFYLVQIIQSLCDIRASQKSATEQSGHGENIHNCFFAKLGNENSSIPESLRGSELLSKYMLPLYCCQPASTRYVNCIRYRAPVSGIVYYIIFIHIYTYQ